MNSINFSQAALPLFAFSKKLAEKKRIAPTVYFDGEDILIKGALELFARDFSEKFGVSLKIAEGSGNGIELVRKNAGEIKLPTPSVFPECEAENYRIDTYDGGLKIGFTGIKSLNHALSGILRNAEADGGEILWEYSEVLDGPQAKYRSLLVDLGKYFHPFENLYDYIDLCFLNNMNYFQVHFNDFLCYCLPSERYPKLPTEGMNYTRQQLRELNSYALRRGVSLVPEIDIPGHCTAFQNAYPELFGTDGIISMHADSMAAIRDIIDEISDMFPYSEYFHIGGDEAEILKWTECEKCLEYFKTVDEAAVSEFKNGGEARRLAERMLAGFVTECAEQVKKNGKTPIVWEGFNSCVNEYISRDIVVMSWENYYQTTQELLDAGFNIINCAWNPLYIVTPRKMWSPEEILDWDIFSWSAVHPDSPFLDKLFKADEKYKSRIWGAQLHAWGDKLSANYGEPQLAADAEKECIAQRLPSVSAELWNTRERKEEYKGSVCK